MSEWGNRKGSIAKSIEQSIPSVPVGCVGEVEIRLTVWLCIIRSRLPSLQSRIVDEIGRRGTGYKIERHYSPIDHVMRVWMEDTLHETESIQMSDQHDSRALPVLCVLIELMLREARGVMDYRKFFPFLMDRINVYVEYLMRGIIPKYGVRRSDLIENVRDD